MSDDDTKLQSGAADSAQPTMQPAPSQSDAILSSLNARIASLELQLTRVESYCREIRQVVGPFGVVYPDGTVLVQTIYGTKYFIKSSDTVMAPQLIIYRQWEADLSKFFLSVTTRDTVFVDVGANIGYFTCLVASRIGRAGTGKVVAIEANPRVYSILKRNISINWSMSDIATHCCGASAEQGTATLFVPKSGAANASLAAPPEDAESTNVAVEVKTEPVDRLIPKGTVVDLMKIDVEGFELSVLRGAAETIRSSRSITVIIEWSLSQMRRAGFAPAAFFEFCRSMGLGIYRVPPNIEPGRTVNWDEFALEPQKLANTEYDNIVLRHVEA